MGSLKGAIRASGLSFRHAATGRGLQELDLVVETGQTVAVVGPNGSGKSTLLGLLATRLRGSGALEIMDSSVAAASAGSLLRQIGFASDVPVHLDELSGRANALFFAEAAGLSRHEAAQVVERLMSRFGLGAHAAEPVGAYSFGMRRKLLLVEALAHDPAVILLDEPTVGLDESARALLWRVLAERAGAGSTIVLATNDLTQLAERADRVLFLSGGRCIVDDSPSSLIESLHGATRVDVVCQNLPQRLPDPPGGVSLERRPWGLAASSRLGSSPVPELLATLLATGTRIDSVAIRSPGLAEAFEALTGERLPIDGHDGPEGSR